LRATIRENERKEISAPERYHGRRRIFEDMLKAEVLCRLRSGAWIGEGYSEGTVEPKRPATAWWQCDVNLDLFAETVEWNGVRLSGLGIYLGDLAASQGEDTSTAHRTKNKARRGRDYAAKDRPLIEAMHQMLTGSPPAADTVWEATDRVVDQATGGGQRDAKRKRLAARYHAFSSIQSDSV